MAAEEDDAVRRQLLEDNAYFRRVLDLIPAQFYFTFDAKRKLRGEEEEEEEDEEEEETSRSKRRKKAKKQAAEITNKATQRRRKFDPAQASTVTGLQQQLIDAEREEKQPEKVRAPRQDVSAQPNLNQTGDLKERLEEKIKTLQAKRKAYHGPDCLEKTRLKRRESKLKMKMKQKAEKNQLNKVKQAAAAANGKSPAGKTPTKKPIYNQEGKMVFSKFDFSGSGDGKEKKDSNALVGKNYKKLLDKVQKQKAKVQKLAETDSAAAATLQEKTQWNTVLHKAQGLKVKDDPELIKKAIKRKEKLKERGKKKWDDRQDKVKETMKAKQDKRRSNIQKKKETHKDNKVKKQRKKGRMLPGF